MTRQSRGRRATIPSQQRAWKPVAWARMAVGPVPANSQTPSSATKLKLGSRTLMDFHAALPGGQHFAGIQETKRIEDLLELGHHVQGVGRELIGHQFHLFHANTVLSGDRPAHRDAVAKDVLTRMLSLFEFARYPRQASRDTPPRTTFRVRR